MIQAASCLLLPFSRNTIECGAHRTSHYPVLSCMNDKRACPSKQPQRRGCENIFSFHFLQSVHTKHLRHIQVIMSHSRRYPPVLQKFISTNGSPLTGVRCHGRCTATKTGKHYLRWSDVQSTFKNISHVEFKRGEIVLLAIDGNGELSVPVFKYDKMGMKRKHHSLIHLYCPSMDLDVALCASITINTEHTSWFAVTIILGSKRNPCLTRKTAHPTSTWRPTLC